MNKDKQLTTVRPSNEKRNKARRNQDFLFPFPSSCTNYKKRRHASLLNCTYSRLKMNVNCVLINRNCTIKTQKKLR